MSASGGFLDLAESMIPEFLIGGTTYDPFDETNAHIAIGDGTTAYASSQTDLQGSSSVRIAVSAGYPQRSGAVLTYQTIADEDTANFDWNEWGIVNAATGGEMLVRAVQDLGTKAQGAEWKFTGTITVAIPS